jgi:hypothetical protein
LHIDRISLELDAEEGRERMEECLFCCILPAIAVRAEILLVSFHCLFYCIKREVRVKDKRRIRRRREIERRGRGSRRRNEGGRRKEVMLRIKCICHNVTGEIE